MVSLPHNMLSCFDVHCSLYQAWVLGASDPSSGTVSVHEMVRGFGALIKKGWKPLRTIVIASWDAEEASAFCLGLAITNVNLLLSTV